MKRQIALCFLLISVIVLSSCSDSAAPKISDDLPETTHLSATEETTEIPADESTAVSDFETTPLESTSQVKNPYEKIFVDLNAVAVEWGEFADNIVYTKQRKYDFEDEARELTYIGALVKYRKIYESTLAEESPMMPFFTAPKRLNLLTDAHISEGYDDVILIPEFYKENIVKGDTAVLFLDMIGEIEKQTFYGVKYVSGIIGNEYYESEYIGAFPCKDDKLDFDPVDYGFPYHCLVNRLSDVSYINSVFKRLDKGYPLFEPGTNIDDLEEYFDLVTDSATFAPLFGD